MLLRYHHHGQELARCRCLRGGDGSRGIAIVQLVLVLVLLLLLVLVLVLVLVLLVLLLLLLVLVLALLLSENAAWQGNSTSRPASSSLSLGRTMRAAAVMPFAWRRRNSGSHVSQAVSLDTLPSSKHRCTKRKLVVATTTDRRQPAIALCRLSSGSILGVGMVGGGGFQQRLQMQSPAVPWPATGVRRGQSFAQPAPQCTDQSATAAHHSVVSGDNESAHVWRVHADCTILTTPPPKRTVVPPPLPPPTHATFSSGFIGHESRCSGNGMR